MPLNNNRQSQRPARVWRAVWLLLLLAGAAFIRVNGADHYYYSSDEAVHLRMAQADSLGQAWQFAHYEAHPPLGNFLRYYWIRLSDDPDCVRAQSLLFGLVLIPLFYRIGRKLGGEAAGIATATLIAFSHGCIIQSYVVRNYALFLLLLSAMFYYYLCWREGGSRRALSAYAAFAILAALTHFSAAFTIALLFGYESLTLLARKDFRRLTEWAAANGTALACAIWIYYLWQPILTPLQPYFASFGGALSKRIHHALDYPLFAGDQLFASHESGIAMLGLLPIALLLSRASGPAFTLRRLCLIAFLALLLGAGLLLSGIYPPHGTRRSLWVLPLVIPAAGWALAWAYEAVMRHVPQVQQMRLPLLAVALLALGFALHRPEERFRDGSEYVWLAKDWALFDHAMQSLGPRDLIVTEKDDGIMLANLYPSMAGAFEGKSMAAVAPYRNTHILFNPYYPRNYSTAVFIANLKEAETNHYFDGIDRLVFLRMAWSRSPLTDIALCSGIQERLVTFPDLRPSVFITRDIIHRARAVLVIADKAYFLSMLSDPASRLNACLNGAHDHTPGFEP